MKREMILRSQISSGFLDWIEAERNLHTMPCYRKDDRAMRPIAYMGALKIFESPCIATPI